jgi:hypothetical protein
MELLFPGLRGGVDLKFMFDYVSAHPHEIRCSPCENIIVFVQQWKQLSFFI